MRDRGSLVSTRCDPTEIIPCIDGLRDKISESMWSGVHWIVQERIEPRRIGHLSNERRVSYEPRDWLVEVESSSDAERSASRVGVRHWREDALAASDLSCASETQITLRLRLVARWAVQFSPRLHFEWLWDGRKLWIVQADPEGPLGGEDPTAILSLTIPTPVIGSLGVFRIASGADYERYGKLQNAAAYSDLGYQMPPFYIVNDHHTIKCILNGEMTTDCRDDLNELVARPLIIRTDGTNIPSGKREMLPRSDPLASLGEASDWLLGSFRAQIESAGLADAGLCMIAHHFIPSVASAWARAEPGSRIVRIESLWGIPEGLYWYAHDTFEVDTQHVKLQVPESLTDLRYEISKHQRYKPTFVVANTEGKWDAAQVRPPFDWRFSIKRTEWLVEIALTTRRLAETNGFPVALMWFVGNHPAATTHAVLPWYHVKSELISPRRAGPRQKLSSSAEFSIKNVADWEHLKSALQNGSRVERVTVEPVDASLIRNQTFAKELGELGASRRFVIELSGGILSHVYYILTKEGAQVACIDLFGADEERVEYNKVVRDKIPEIIKKQGEMADVIRLEGEAPITALKRKLVEEAFEALDAKSGGDLIGELADLREVVDAVCRALNISSSEIMDAQKEKRHKRGGFDQGIMLTRTTTPHSLEKEPAEADSDELTLEIERAGEQVITHPADLPDKPLYRRPDLRQVDEQPEKLFTFGTDVNKLGDLRATLHFSLPIDPETNREFALTVELHRSAGALRGTIRIRLVPTQIPIDFPDRTSE
jgi:predicted house-cleaning noncanonical NTP pyrophosphatase (MazG superfamily)